MALDSANWPAITPCLAYASSSASMVLVNKSISLVAVEAKTGTFFFIAYQALIATLCVEIARRYGKVRYETNIETLMQWLPVNACFILMLITSFMSMKTVSIPVATVFKNLTNVFIVMGDWFLNSQPVSPLILLSLAVMCSGAVLTSMSDIEFSPYGYIWMGLNCIATAAYVLIMRHATKTIKIERAGMVYYNNFMSFIMLLVLSIVCGESGVLIGGGQVNLMLFCLLTFSGLVGVFLSFASLWCVGSTSATTYAIVGTLNKIPTTFFGAIIFHSQITSSGMLYIAVMLFGGFLYSWAKLPKNSVKDHKIPTVAERTRLDTSSSLSAHRSTGDSHGNKL